jgi:dienelactone hydrolase
VVIVIDALYFGERRLRVEELAADRVQPEVRDAHAAARAAPPGSPAWTTAVDRMASFYEHLTAKAITATGFTWPGLLAWDDLRAVDHLVARPDVDPARIGCLGLSGGGFRTALAIGCDPRIRAACVTGWMTEFGRQLPRHLRHTWMVYVPGLHRDLDLPDVAALHAPGALLVQQCRRDHLFPLDGMEAAVAKLAAAYSQAGVPERFRGSFHDLPHSFPPRCRRRPSPGSTAGCNAPTLALRARSVPASTPRPPGTSHLCSPSASTSAPVLFARLSSAARTGRNSARPSSPIRADAKV